MKIFITGFHHSGTSFLTEIVERLGFNLGDGSVARHKEHPFLSKIDDSIIGGDWENPKFDYSSDDIEVVENMEKPEVYKNPRLMITWPFWNEKFPDAKWIVIDRSELNVAKSIMDDDTRKQDQKYWLDLIKKYSNSFLPFLRSAVIEDKALIIHYAALCNAPSAEVTKIGRFLGCSDDKIKEVVEYVKANAKYKTYEHN